MPYIKQDLRPKFQETINDVVLTVMRSDLPKIIKIEMFGYFVSQAIAKYTGISTLYGTTFNSTNFDAGTRKSLQDYAAKLMSMINCEDVIQSVGDLNYVISTVWLGVLGAHPDVETANYGFRCLTRSAVEKVLEDVRNVKTVQISESRRLLGAKGALADIVSEMYRRQTTPYEDLKISENGDINFWSQS